MGPACQSRKMQRNTQDRGHFLHWHQLQRTLFWGGLSLVDILESIEESEESAIGFQFSAPEDSGPDVGSDRIKCRLRVFGVNSRVATARLQASLDAQWVRVVRQTPVLAPLDSDGVVSTCPGSLHFCPQSMRRRAVNRIQRMIDRPSVLVVKHIAPLAQASGGQSNQAR